MALLDCMKGIANLVAKPNGLQGSYCLGTEIHSMNTLRMPDFISKS